MLDDGNGLVPLRLFPGSLNRAAHTRGKHLRHRGEKIPMVSGLRPAEQRSDEQQAGTRHKGRRRVGARRDELIPQRADSANHADEP